MPSLRVACLQNAADQDPEIGSKEAEELARKAVGEGAELLVLPEFFSCLHLGRDGMTVGTANQADHPELQRFQALSKELGCWLHLGSLGITMADGRTANRAFLLDPSGEIRATYDKIHLFDVDLSGGESYRESDTIHPGDRAVVAETPWGGLGLSICYDLRFPHLYRQLAQAGASMIVVPAAFTKKTGEAHWHVLLRARAIETGCYVFAPCQYGRHGKAETYGHSLIIDPWGTVLADAGEGSGFAVADIDLDKVRQVRSMIPSLRHDRDFAAAQ
ncbi:MAG: carbon-nitrogen hydrolase family protein [Magnetovibrionaceae bacterium]